MEELDYKKRYRTKRIVYKICTVCRKPVYQEDLLTHVEHCKLQSLDKIDVQKPQNKQLYKKHKISKTISEKTSNQHTLEKIRRLIVNSKLPLSVAQGLIQASVYWTTHPSGEVKSPRHSERITDGEHGWEVSFGTTVFHIELSIKKITNRFINSSKKYYPMPLDDIFKMQHKELINCIGKSISHNGVLRVTPHAISRGDSLTFGASAVKLSAFLSEAKGFLKSQKLK